MPTLHITEISKTYSNGITALEDISLHIQQGLFGLLGPNGAGKSSLMKIIAGLLSADRGSIHFNGTDILQDPISIKRQLGYLPQDFGVYPGVSAYTLLSYLAVLKGVPRQDRREQVLALLQKVNLYEQRNRYVHQFSGGMRQRFGIAQALLGNPQLILVDEPTAGLDPEERNRFNNLLSELSEQIVVILSTHIVEDVRSLCTQMAIIRQGKLVANGSPLGYLDLLSGRIWKKKILKQELPHYQECFQVLSTQLNEGRLTVQVLSDGRPGEGFELAAPALEDVYFAHLSKYLNHA